MSIAGAQLLLSTAERAPHLRQLCGRCREVIGDFDKAAFDVSLDDLLPVGFFRGASRVIGWFRECGGHGVYRCTEGRIDHELTLEWQHKIGHGLAVAALGLLLRLWRDWPPGIDMDVEVLPYLD